MVNGDERQVRRDRGRLGERDADEQRPDEPGSLGHRNRAKIAPCRARVDEGAIDNAADVSDVLARSELGHHAAPFAMNLDLRRRDIRANRPRLARVAGLFDDGGGGLVARGFDAEDHHERIGLS